MYKMLVLLTTVWNLSGQLSIFWEEIWHISHITWLLETDNYTLIGGNMSVIFWPYLTGVLAVVMQGLTCEGLRNSGTDVAAEPTHKVYVLLSKS